MPPRSATRLRKPHSKTVRRKRCRFGSLSPVGPAVSGAKVEVIESDKGGGVAS